MDPHQSQKLSPDQHPIADDMPKCMEYEPEHFKNPCLYLEAGIRIRIKVKSRIRIRVKVESRIRIRIKVMRISNTDPGCGYSNQMTTYEFKKPIKLSINATYFTLYRHLSPYRYLSPYKDLSPYRYHMFKNRLPS